MRVFAPAKINLTLKVGSPLANGRHPLSSIVAFADVGDWVAVEEAPSLSLRLGGPFAADLASEADNLVLRAARALGEHTPGRGAAIHLEKNLPVASGMGGGSSDAAAALKALRALWEVNLDGGDLAALGATLGADIPACLLARTGLMTGTGEAYAPTYAPAFDAVLVNPRVQVSTADVFRAFDRSGLGAAFDPATPKLSTRDDALAAFAALGNDLESTAIALAPQIGEALALLRADARSLYAAMTGSGATVFALVAGPDDAEDLAAAMREQRPAWWSRATMLGGA